MAKWSGAVEDKPAPDASQPPAAAKPHPAQEHPPAAEHRPAPQPATPQPPHQAQTRPPQPPAPQPQHQGGAQQQPQQQPWQGQAQGGQPQQQHYQQHQQNYSGGQQWGGQPGMPGSGRKKKKKKKKGGGMGMGMGMSGMPGQPPMSHGPIPQHVLPSDEVLNAALVDLGEPGSKKYKDAEKSALKIADLRKMDIIALHNLAEKEALTEYHQLAKPELILRIIKSRAAAGGLIVGEGTLDIAHDGMGFLRSPEYSYLANPDDIYLSPSQVRRHGLKRGMIVRGPVRAPAEGERFTAMLRVDEVNGKDPAVIRSLSNFEDLTPLHPEERYVLETTPDQIEMRIVDLVAPVGKGQRGLIVAPPRTGKTVLLQKMTQAITKNYPDVRIIVLLIDERPEEVTDFKRNTEPSVEVIASTFDEQASRHVQVTEMVIEKAKRAVEFGEDVVILLDSITRLARAYNNEMPHSGKIMTGGIDSGALQRPKKFFGAARAIENGGSLTILATALVDTGSKADEVIFEEFKGTGNSELHLDRKLVEKRIWPAINVGASGTRREELLLDKKELELVYRLRKVLSDMNVVEAMELMRGRLGKVKTNAEFLMTMNLG